MQIDNYCKLYRTNTELVLDLYLKQKCVQMLASGAVGALKYNYLPSAFGGRGVVLDMGGPVGGGAVFMAGGGPAGGGP